jgi:hypothetical protein
VAQHGFEGCIGKREALATGAEKTTLRIVLMSNAERFRLYVYSDNIFVGVKNPSELG